VPWVPLSRRVGVVLARDTSAITVPLRHIGLLLGGVSVSAMLVSAGFLWWTIRRSLRPLGRLARQIERLDSEDLSARLPEVDAPLEIEPVIERTNQLLHRLEKAFLRERSMGANVAHEVRTPLAGLRSTIEVALSRPRSSEQQEAALRQCLRIVLEMQAMVENLLLLARIDAGHARGESRPVVLEERLLGSWRPLEATAAARRLQVEWAIGHEARVTTDATLLDVALRNVLENAVEYADRGGTVRIETAARDGGADVLVRNTGSTLRQEDVAHVFDRFWRGAAARSEAGLHCGLGLVLVKEIMGALGGAAEVRSAAGGCFEIALSIPDSGRIATVDRSPTAN
jgi:two-component system, OmpR family, heavy metal sensor histidine kinase CusS